MKKERDLTNRVVLITGASSGIGAACAKLFAQEGASLALAARRENKLEKLAQELRSEFGAEALAVPTDVRKESEVDAMVKSTIDKWKGLDVLVSNAGLGLGGKVEKLTTNQYRAMVETNVDGMFFSTRAALPHLKEVNGNLIFLGSFSGQYPRPANPVYAATKWWTRGFALSVEASVGEEGVAVTVINPTEVRTEFGSEEGKPIKKRFDYGEVTEPNEVAQAIIFAAGQRNSTVSEIDFYRRDKMSHF